MTSMSRLRVTWNGLTALPGLSTFYIAGSASTLPSAVSSFFTGISSRFPTGLTWDIPTGGDVLEVETGTLTGTWGSPGSFEVDADGGNVRYAAGVGAQLQWTTGKFINGRRMRGSTFLCPLGVDAYETNGTLEAAVRQDILDAAAVLLASIPIDLWHRPTSEGADGDTATIEGAVVPDRVTSLRSRRY